MENFIVGFGPASAEQEPATTEFESIAQQADSIASFMPHASSESPSPSAISAEAASSSPPEAAGEHESDLEAMLAEQAQELHGIFKQAAQKFRGSKFSDDIRMHSAVALKAQNYCRMTVTGLAKIRQEKQAFAAKKRKPQNELLVSHPTC